MNALTDYAWWNGRDGTPNYYWNGSKSSNSRGCACYETDSCEDIGHDHRSEFIFQPTIMIKTRHVNPMVEENVTATLGLTSTLTKVF